MKSDQELEIFEIEEGSHFVTMYGLPFQNLLAFASEMYHYWIRRHPETAQFQQKHFAHQVNDPNVYHPFGNPRQWRPKSFRHFHIRFGRKTTSEDIQEVKDFIEKYAPKSKNIQITNLEDKKLDKYAGLCYPSVPTDPNCYLQWIETLRTGAWRKKPGSDPISR